MPLKKIIFKSGVNRENTRYTTEGGWYECDKVRFRQGTPEKVGGWYQLSTATFLGVCRSLWNWITLGNQNLLSVGTNLKFYIENGGTYNDITPTETVDTLTNPFATVNGLTTVTVTDAGDDIINGDFVTFTGGTAVGGLTINGEYQLTKLTNTTYTITASSAASSTTTGGGTVYAVYQINTGPAYSVPLVGWGAGGWGSGTWGIGASSTDSLRLWSQANFGEDLVFGPRGGGMYYWDASIGYSNTVFTVTIASPGVVTSTLSLINGTAIILKTTGALPTGLLVGTVYYVVSVSGFTFSLALTVGGAPIVTSGTQSGIHKISPEGINLTYLNGASDVPTVQNFIAISDASRFVFAFGCNDYSSTVQDPMLIRWSDQESTTKWTPLATNQAGSLRLSHGSQIITALQTRQEILVWTDSSLYSLQYLGAPAVWGSQLLGDGISIVGQNACIAASGVVYWMGIDKFYKYDGSVSTLSCDLRQFVYGNINLAQASQFFASTNEGFNEIWFFYCSADSVVIDTYVVYNYLEQIWYYGYLGRTAWLDTGLRNYPLAATYSYNIVQHEYGVDNGTTLPATAIDSYIISSEFDIDDGHNFGFVWRILPDLTFRGSSSANPSMVMTLYPLQNSGSGYNSPLSEGGSAYATVQRTSTVTVEQYTGTIFVRVRGRQMAFKVGNNNLGDQWQLGAPRIDIRKDGRRGNT
jgi:hypothetical protein